MSKAREYLEEYACLSEDVNNITETLAEVREQFESIKSLSFDEHISTGSHASVTELLYERVEEKETKLADAISKRMTRMFDIMNILERMDEPYGTILFYRYIKLMAWDEIALTLNYSRTHVCSPLHNKALRMFQAELDKTNQ